MYITSRIRSIIDPKSSSNFTKCYLETTKAAEHNKKGSDKH